MHEHARAMKASVILGYHRVVTSPPGGLIERHLTVTASRFRRHLESLAHRFRIVPLDDLVARLSDGAGGGGMAAVTFDDGYADNYLCAFPILSQMGIPATVFLTTEYVERARSFWTDRLAGFLGGAAGAVITLPDELGGQIDLTSPGSAQQSYWDLRAKLQAWEDGCRRERVLDVLGAVDPPGTRPLTWDEIRRMHRGGIAFGAHTGWHSSLVALSDGGLRAEIEASRDLIAARVGVTPTIFAYPFGDADERVSRAVDAAGFHGAVTVRAEACWTHSPRFLLPRLMVIDSTGRAFARELETLERGAGPTPWSTLPFTARFTAAGRRMASTAGNTLQRLRPAPFSRRRA